MNSISIAHAGNQKYYLALGKEEGYYTKANDPSGIFKGEGAKRLGIENQQIEQNDKRLKNLFLGLSPDGTQVLRQGAYQVRTYKSWQFTDPSTGKVKTFKSERSIPSDLKDRVKELKEVRRSVVAYDNTLSAPKDFSLLFALAPDDLTRRRLDSIHKYAVSKATEYLEKNACYVRSGKGGSKCQKAQGIFSVFHHTTSRELDVQLHSHVVMLNTGFNGEGKALALDGRKVLEHRYAAGMVYQNTLRRSLELNFGVQTFDRPFSDGRGVSFSISGISPELRLEFSRRSGQILERITPDMSPLEVRKEVLASRKPKDLSVKTEDLLAVWQERGKALGFIWEDVVGKSNQYKPESRSNINEQIATHLQQHPNTDKSKGIRAISESQITTAALSASRGKLSTEEALGAAHNFKEQFTQPSSVSREHKRFFRLSGAGRELISHDSVRISLYGTAKNIINYYIQWTSDQRRKVLISSKSNSRFSRNSIKTYKLKMICLYATGKITRGQYLRLTQDKGMPVSKFKINVYEALGLISARQAYRLMNKHESDSFWKSGDPFARNLSLVPPIDTLVAYSYRARNETISKENTQKNSKQKSYEYEV